MGKVYGKNASGSTQLIIDGDAIDQRLSTLEANWDSISPIVLFDNDDNPVNDDVVLSDSAANYSLLVIEGKDLDGFYCYAMAFDPDGKTVVLETTRCTSATWFHLNSRCVAISGNTIKTSKVNNSSWGETAQINLTGNNIANHINVIAITKVLGFK